MDHIHTQEDLTSLKLAPEILSQGKDCYMYDQKKINLLIMEWV